MSPSGGRLIVSASDFASHHGVFGIETAIVTKSGLQGMQPAVGQPAPEKKGESQLANTKPLKLINIKRRYKRMVLAPRMPNFAAWIEGVDLTRTIEPAVADELRMALDDFEVICFHPQTLTPAQHVALAKVFGPVSGGSYFERRKDAPEVEIIESDRERPPPIDHWHTDIAWKKGAPLTEP
jgi:hypothetical protein